MSRYLSGSSSHSSSSLLTSSSLWSSVLWLEGCNWNSVFPDSAAKEEQAEYWIEEFARTLIISFSSMSSVLAFLGNSAIEIINCICWIIQAFWVVLIFYLYEDRRTDKITICFFFYYMKETLQIPKSPYFCWVKDHRWGHIVVRTSVTLDRLHFVCYIFLLTTLRPHLWFITEQTHGNMESLYRSDIFSEYTFQFTVQASKFCKKEYALSNSYLFLIKGVCYPLLCLFPTT